MAQLQILKPRIAMAIGKVVMADQSRGQTESRRITGSRWMKIRLRILRRDMGLCQECYRNGRTHGLIPSTCETDHVIPLEDGGSNDDDNLQSLCHSCHEAKTAAEAKARARG